MFLFFYIFAAGMASLSSLCAKIRLYLILALRSIKRWTGAIICMRPNPSAINRENYIVPVWMI